MIQIGEDEARAHLSQIKTILHPSESILGFFPAKQKNKADRPGLSPRMSVLDGHFTEVFQKPRLCGLRTGPIIKE